jgi:hypothetical protein
MAFKSNTCCELAAKTLPPDRLRLSFVDGGVSGEDTGATAMLG